VHETLIVHSTVHRPAGGDVAPACFV